MREVVQKLMSTPLISFQDLKLSTRDIIAILKDTLNTTSGPLPITDPHTIGAPSNTQRDTRLVHLLQMAFIIYSLVLAWLNQWALLPLIPYQKGVKNTSLVDLLLIKGVVDNHSLHKVSHSFPKVVLSERTSIATRVAIINNIESVIQVGGHTPKAVLFYTGAYFLIQGRK